jgi:hypothetical protein
MLVGLMLAGLMLAGLMLARLMLAGLLAELAARLRGLQRARIRRR